MYPLVPLLGMAMVRRDLRSARLYALPLAVVGIALSTYHYLLERFPGQIHLNCGVGQPDCAVSPFNVFGFVSISYMALGASLLILTLLLTARPEEWEPEEEAPSAGEEAVPAGPRTAPAIGPRVGEGASRRAGRPG